MPFTVDLVNSNRKNFRYEWIWEKSQGTGHLNSNRMPLKIHENILIYYDKLPCYNPQMGKGKPYKAISGRMSSNYDINHSKTVFTDNKGERYPQDVIKFLRDKKKYHPTEKPVDLCEYLVKTYTDEGETVLDNCMGSGTTGIACINTNRNFIGIEIDDNYFEIARERIEATENQLRFL